MFIDLVRLHVFLYIGLLGKWPATDDALKWFLSCVTDGEIELGLLGVSANTHVLVWSRNVKCLNWGNCPNCLI